jgi:hypothetical protein
MPPDARVGSNLTRIAPFIAAAWFTVIVPASQCHAESKIGVFTINISGLDPSFGDVAIDAIATAVTEVGRFDVVSRTEINAMLGAEFVKDAVGCTDTSCLAEIGGASGVDRIVGGSLSRVNDVLMVNLQLINVARATAEKRATVNWSGPMSEFQNVLGASAELLTIPSNELQPGKLRTSGVPPDGVVVVDGAPRGVGSVTVADLAVGTHTLAIETPGFERYEAPFVVRHARLTNAFPQLVSLPESPFYAKWWFWTATGVVVASLGASSYLLLGSDDASGPRDAPTGTISVKLPPLGE